MGTMSRAEVVSCRPRYANHYSQQIQYFFYLFYPLTEHGYRFHDAKRSPQCWHPGFDKAPCKPNENTSKGVKRITLFKGL